MKRSVVRFLIFMLAGSFFLTGCATHSQHAVTVTPSGQIMVPDPQDHERREKAGVSGVGPYGWMKGYWTYYGGRWVWVPGHWQEPANGANWVEGHWDRTPEGNVWVPGHWA